MDQFIAISAKLQEAAPSTMCYKRAYHLYTWGTVL